LISCLGAGLRAAELSCRDGWGSWAVRALERRRRRAKSDVISRLRKVEQRRCRAAATPSQWTSTPGAGVTPHPIVLGRGETPRRAAVPQGGDAPSPGLWTTGRRTVVLFCQSLSDRVSPGRPHHNAPRPRPRCGNARRAGPRSRVARRTEVLETGLRAVERILLQVWAGGSQGRAHPSARTGLAAPPVGRRSRGAAVSRRRAPHVAPSAPFPRAGVWLGLPTRSGTRRRPDRSHPSEAKGRRRRTERTPANGRAA
jgi:hypothetical protein